MDLSTSAIIAAIGCSIGMLLLIGVMAVLFAQMGVLRKLPPPPPRDPYGPASWQERPGEPRP